MRYSRLSLLLAVFLIELFCASAKGEELKEGDNGYFCRTDDGTDRLFRKGDFIFCGSDGVLPATVGFAVIGERRPELFDAIERFSRILTKNTGIVLRADRRPRILFVVPSVTTVPPISTTPQRREKAFADLLAKADVELPPAYLSEIGRHTEPSVPANAAGSLDTLKASGKPVLVVRNLAPSDNDPVFDRIVKETVVEYLAIKAPMIEKEQKSSDGVYATRREGKWLAISR